MNPTKAMQLLDLPSELSVFEGQVQKKVTYSILWIETNDFRTGKRVTSNSFTTQSSTQSFGAYALNLMSNYIHAYGCTPIGFNDDGSEFTMYNESEDKVVTQGQFAGLTYHYPWQKVLINKNTMRMMVISEPYIFVNTDGTPTPTNDPWILVQKQTRTITQTSTTMGSKTSVRIKASLFKSMSGYDDLTTAMATRVEFPIVVVDPSKYITSIAMDIEHPSPTQFKGVFHINGVPANTPPWYRL